MNSDTPRSLLSFIATSLSLIAVYVTSATPIPLYGIYQEEAHIGYFSLSLSSVVYFIGAVTALVILGRLSNHIGRKPVSLISLILAASSVIFFLNINSATTLISGRLLQGLACGLASTGLASWLTDHGKAVPSWIPPAVISCGPMTGLTIGGIGSGFIVDFSTTSLSLPFYLSFCLLAICTILILFSKETMPRSTQGILKSLKPDFHLPYKSRQAYSLAAVTFICTWSLGGFFQAFGPAMAREQLHSSSTLAAALVFASIMAPSSIGASIAAKMAHTKSQLLGMLGFTLFIGGILISLYWGQLALFLVASIFAGIAQGLVLTGSIGTMVTHLEPYERANVFSVIYTTSYVGAAIPTLIAGQYSQTYSLLEVASGYAVLACVGSVLVLSHRVFNSKRTLQPEQEET